MRNSFTSKGTVELSGARICWFERSTLNSDPFAWLGDHVSLYIDADDELLGRIEDGELDFDEDLKRLRAVVRIASSNGLRLAAFVTALRTLVEGSAPGAVEWHQESEGEHRFVRLSADDLADDLALYYATTSDAWILSLHRESLVQALERGSRSDEPGAASRTASWAGASAGLEISAGGLEALELLDETSVRHTLRRRVFQTLPILNEWKRRFPDFDPYTDLYFPGGVPNAYMGSTWGLRVKEMDLNTPRPRANGPAG